MRFEVTTREGIGIIDNTIEDEGARVITNGFAREVSARVICDKLNELQELAESKPLDLHRDFEEWDTLIKSLPVEELKLIDLKEYRDKEKQRILTTFDFKKEYGKNNEDIRKQHIKKELSSTYDDINALELKIADDKRRIIFLKSLIAMKIELLRIGVRE